MADPIPRRIAITGAPGAGKSTLLDALEKRGWTVVPEAARAILQAPGGMSLRAEDPDGFARAMLEVDLAAFDRVGSGETAIFDRGFADIIAFLRIEGRVVPANLMHIAQEKRFDWVFRARAWRGIYRQDSERIQTFAQASESDREVSGAWRELGYDLVELPFASVEERVGFVEAHLLGRSPAMG